MIFRGGTTANYFKDYFFRSNNNYHILPERYAENFSHQKQFHCHVGVVYILCEQEKASEKYYLGPWEKSTARSAEVR